MLYSTSVGLDVHARSIKAAAFIPQTGEIREKAFSYDADAIVRWAKTLPQPVQCVYESGPTGFDLLRKLEASGVSCIIGAVSKMLRPAGDKIKNDKRDAIFLSRMLAVGNIVEVYVPTPEDEAARDLARARADVRQDLCRAKHLLSKFLLRKGIVYDKGKKAWTKTHRRWLEGLEMATVIEQQVLEEYLLSVEELERKRERLDKAIGVLGTTPRWGALVSKLCLLRGIATVSAFAIATEIGDFSRFPKASAFYSYLGLVPSLDESGESSHSGKITKTGNGHVRKLLVEAAWHHRRLYRPSSVSANPQSPGLSPHVVQEARKANIRLHDRAVHFRARKLHSCKANTAVARELAGWVWTLANMA
jgi:transposase